MGVCRGKMRICPAVLTMLQKCPRQLATRFVLAALRAGGNKDEAEGLTAELCQAQAAAVLGGVGSG